MCKPGFLIIVLLHVLCQSYIHKSIFLHLKGIVQLIVLEISTGATVIYNSSGVCRSQKKSLVFGNEFLQIFFALLHLIEHLLWKFFFRFFGNFYTCTATDFRENGVFKNIILTCI